MKLNLVLDSDATIPGYTTINPFADPNSKSQVCCDVTQFDQVCDDAEAQEIIAEEILEYFPLSSVDSILNYWLKKIAHGGVLKIIGLDTYRVAEGLLTQKLNIEEYNMYMYGHQAKDWQFRKNMLSGERILGVLANRGFKIKTMQLNGYQFVIEAERP